MTIQHHESDETTPVSAIPSDGCPEWASELISRILVLEVEAGTIKNPNENTAANGWSTANLDDLAKVAGQMDKQAKDDISEEVETLFGKVARGLTSEGQSPEVISAMINARIPTGCRLSYCSASEVRDALA